MSEKMSDMGVTHALARAEHGDERDRVAACKALATHISTLQREADGLREALTKLREACEPFQTEVSSWAPDFPPNGVALGDHDPELSVTWADLLSLDIAAMEARAALNGPPQDRSSEEK